MTKRALFAVVGFLGLSLAASQRAQGSEQVSFDGATLEPSSVRLPSLGLEDHDRFFFSTAFGGARPTAHYLPTYYPWEPQYGAHGARPGRRNPVDDIVDLRAPARIHFGGEIGFLYGKSTGTYGREDVAGYIIGTVGNESFSINVGYLRQETTFEHPRGRRR